jgi:hypothetical protein
MWKRRLVKDITFGLAQEVALRQRYQQEDFGLESAFGSEKEARARMEVLHRKFGLSDAEIRLVQNISRTGGQERTIWQVYAKAGKGVSVFLPKSSKEEETSI